MFDQKSGEDINAPMGSVCRSFLNWRSLRSMDILKNSAINGTAYALATAGVIVGEIHDHQLLVYVCRPLMMIILSSWFFFNSRRVGDRFTLLIQVGIFFSLVADVAMMFQHLDQFNLLVGMGVFLIVQLCYMMAFVHNVNEVSGGESPVVPLVLALVLTGYCFLFAGRLAPYVDETLAVPLLVYAIAMTAMGVAAGFRFGRTFVRSYLMVMVGALFFITSHSFLATNRFMRPLEHAEWSVILTYSLAQYLIVAGCLVHVLDPEEIRRKAALST
jgi:uncharacterized membrane protein YhhN